MARKLKQLQIYLKYQQRIYQFFWYRLNYNQELAEDMCSEVFFQMLKNWDNFDQQKAAFPWLLGIARNIWCNYLRGLGKVVNWEDVPQPLIEESEAWLDKLELERTLAGIEKLPDTLRDLLLLRHLEGLEYQEIAALLNKQEGAVRTQLCRARKKLKQLIGYE